ncbi:helix-turn-helix domain-containing protein [Paraburkholderia ferrariae]|uniref:helix-turn-helix domain-containing protein n=1 Tax=Paraburkholderia ferrariae TaxID=386056 RepID=UPI00047F5154|nr:helix-turn-helix domain-containing protein [Paraburkholderia ferrariae]
MSFLIRSLNDVHDHSIAVDGWIQTYRQITPGAFHSRVAQLSDPDFLFFREETNRRVVQQGISPSGRFSLGLPLYEPITGTFQGQGVDGYAFLMLGPAEEFCFHTQEIMHFIGASLPVEIMTDMVAAVAGEASLRRLRSGVLPMSEKSGAVLRERVAPYLDQMERSVLLTEHPVLGKVFRDELLGQLFDLLAAAADEPLNDLTHRTYSDIVKRCERIIQHHGDEPVTVLDLCRAVRCSRRTLQTSFQRVANVTPVGYLRAYRLNAVRAQLRATSPEELSIGDAANRQGFGHLGYFAQEYRTLFNEMPSQTRRRG